LGKKKK